VDGVHNSHFYVGRLALGQPNPQELQVLFDTASGHLLVPHSSCSSEACNKHQRYSPFQSSTAVDVNTNGKPVKEGQRLVRGKTMRDAVTVEFTQADLGEGKARAVLVHDNVCLGTEFGHQVCTDLDIMAAIKMEDELFNAMPYDGMLGLSMAGLSSGAGCVFFKRLMDSNPSMLPQFGLSLGAQSGEIYFGGHDSARLAEDLKWFPVLHPDDGFWEVAVQAVRLGNVTVDYCKSGCR
ncbi:Ctse, partial [Symbiodinium pilosum]